MLIFRYKALFGLLFVVILNCETACVVIRSKPKARVPGSNTATNEVSEGGEVSNSPEHLHTSLGGWRWKDVNPEHLQPYFLVGGVPYLIISKNNHLISKAKFF